MNHRAAKWLKRAGDELIPMYGARKPALNGAAVFKPLLKLARDRFVSSFPCMTRLAFLGMAR